MATLVSGDSNIVDAETINWRLIVYPTLAAIILMVGGFAYYFYQESQREMLEAEARQGMLQAKTPDALVKVADQFPTTDQATLALLSAANDSFDEKDYATAIKAYQRIVSTPTADATLRDAAQMGLASTLDASGKTDDAINAYLTIAHRGSDSFYAPAAYNAVAQIYQQKGDKANEQSTLVAEASLDPDSEFVKQAQQKLKTLNGVPDAPFASGTVQKQ